LGVIWFLLYYAFPSSPRNTQPNRYRAAWNHTPIKAISFKYLEGDFRMLILDFLIANLFSNNKKAINWKTAGHWTFIPTCAGIAFLIGDKISFNGFG